MTNLEIMIKNIRREQLNDKKKWETDQRKQNKRIKDLEKTVKELKAKNNTSGG